MYVRRRRERSPDGPHRHDRKEECLDRPRDLLPTRVDLCPPLPTSFEAALDEALVALGIALSPPARAAIDGHVRLLLAWNEAINLANLQVVAELVARSALCRTESRGAHYRSDWPQSNPEWLKRVCLASDGNGGSTLSLLPIDFGRLTPPELADGQPAARTPA